MHAFVLAEPSTMLRSIVCEMLPRTGLLAQSNTQTLLATSAQ
jgi:hypothetical protein